MSLVYFVPQTLFLQLIVVLSFIVVNLCIFLILDYAPNYEKTTSSRSNKTKVGFLENLNAKLAEQRLSGKAFAVRNLINSKALVSVFPN